MSILGLLIGLIIGCVLYWAVMKILAAFGIGEPITTVAQVILVLLILFWLLGQFGVIGRGPLRLGLAPSQQQVYSVSVHVSL